MENIQYYYFNNGVPNCMCQGLYYSSKNFNVKEAKTYIENLLPQLANQGIDELFVCDAGYFKVLTGEKSTEYCFGKRYPCKLDSRFTVILGLNYLAFKYDPSLMNKLKTSIACLNNANTKVNNIITHADYTDEHLFDLLSYDKLTVDIETNGLKFHNCGLVSIAFGTDMHGGIAFTVKDKKKLKQFFETYKGTLIFHNASFDVKVLIYELFMKDINDQVGLQYGLHTMYKNIDDTKIIAYLALNSTGKPSYKLKDLAFEYTGKYALEDIGDISKVDTKTELEYNLKDVCATWYVYNKYYPIMVQDKQEKLYRELLLPTQKVLTHTELNGLYMDMNEVAKLKEKLQIAIDDAHNTLLLFDEVKDAERILYKEALDKVNAKLKTKKKTSIDFKINLRSSVQLRVLLYTVMKLPIIKYTESKQPSTEKDVIMDLRSYCNEDQKVLMDKLIELSCAMQIMNNFIPAMESSVNNRLYGNFNIGGTVSGRLSSSSPNLQNLPATGTVWAKPFKKCFKAPDGFVFCGSDFSSLEDHISALLTKDPEKLKVYIPGINYKVIINGETKYIGSDDTIEYNGVTYTGDSLYQTFKDVSSDAFSVSKNYEFDAFDGHCLRAYSYYKHLMPDITEKLEYLNKGGKFYEVIDDEGNVKYLSEYDEEYKKLCV